MVELTCADAHEAGQTAILIGQLIEPHAHLPLPLHLRQQRIVVHPLQGRKRFSYGQLEPHVVNI